MNVQNSPRCVGAMRSAIITPEPSVASVWRATNFQRRERVWVSSVGNFSKLTHTVCVRTCVNEGAAPGNYPG